MADDDKTPDETKAALEEPTAQMGLRRVADRKAAASPAPAPEGEDATTSNPEDENPDSPVPPKDAEAEGDRPAAAGAAWRRILRALVNPKVSGAGAIIALLIGLLGFGLIAQVRSNSSESTLANDRPDDLVRILSDLDARKDRLSTEIAQLQETVRELTSGAEGRQAALAAAAKRAEELGILAGTLGAHGPGLIITLTPSNSNPISADILLDTVEELRGAGAEAMEVTGTGSPDVRIVASTSFVDAAGGVAVDGQTVGGTVVISAIGDPQTMQTALSIAGGVVDTVHNAGGTVHMDQEPTVEVLALHNDTPLRYARPTS